MFSQRRDVSGFYRAVVKVLRHVMQGTYIVSDVSRYRHSPIFKVQEEFFIDCLTLADGTRSVSRN
jgi:hypothetical protein